MKKITCKHALITLLMIVAWMAIINVKGQSTCATAVSFTPSDTFKETTYNITDSIYWLKFVADSNIILQIVPPNKTPKASILHIYLYSGTCSSLTLLAAGNANDSLMIAQGNLTTGNTYYVKVNRTATTSAYFGLGFQYYSKLPPLFICLPSSCNLIRNGLFETYRFPYDNTSPFYPGYTDTLPVNDVCGWMRAWGSPSLLPTPAVNSGNHYAGMWNNHMVGQGEGIMQTINIPAGSYTLNFSYKVLSSSMDSLIVCLTNSDFHEHTSYFIGEAVPYSYWHPSQRDIIYAVANVPVSGSWQHVSSYPFTTTSTYTRVVVYPSQSTNTNTTWLYLDSVSIIATPPAPPVIAGQWDLCHGTPSNPITSDTIKNWNSQYTYYWNIGKNGTQTHFTTSTFNVNWAGHTGGGMLYVEVFNDSTHCSAVDSFKVFGCCINGGAVTFADTTISTSQTIHTGVDINGQIILKANVTVGGTGHAKLYMGPNAKIIIYPGYTLTINDSSQVYAFCDTMWDGIYLTNNTSKLIVRGNSSIRDAKNAIVSNNGGVFQLSNSDTLRNNYKNVVVNTYSATHTGSISHTIITCNATLLPQYPPVTATRTYEGVEIGSVNTIFIGDTTAYSNRNTFNNMDFGIYSGCSQIYVYNNKFININAPAGVSNIGMAVYAFGARNCEGIATVGGQNASGYYRSNYFSNCFNGIYFTSFVSGNITAQYDTLVMQTTAGTYPTGIYAYAAGSSNGIIRYNKITNGNYGIDCVNFGTGSSLNISSNYIQNNNTGIAAADVSAIIPNSLQIAKNYISFPNSYTTTQTGIQVTNVQGSSGIARLALLLNRVVFNNPNYNYMAYGIRVQNSTLDSIEQCSVTNTANPPTDSTSAKKFNGIQVELSPNSYLCEDTVVNTGCGLRFYGSMPASTIEVNYMDSSYYGVRLDGANVGNQEFTLSFMGHNTYFSYGNQWIHTQRRIWGTWTIVLWYGYSLQALTLVPNSNYIHLSPSPTTQIINVGNYFSSCAVGSMQMMLSKTVQDIVNNSYNYTANVAENKYTDKVTAYNILKYEPGILGDTALSAAKYQNFYSNSDAGTIGQLSRINDLMQSQDYTNASLYNSAFAPSNIMEQNHKTVNDIFLNSWATGRFNLTTTEYNTLRNIAAQQPILGGSGVYSARVMVGEPSGNMANARTAGENNNNHTSKSNVIGLIYPNPVTDNASIDYNIISYDRAELNVFSITGKEIADYILNTKENHFTFSTGQFKSGIYFYQIIANGEQVSYNKFIIIK